MNYTVTEGEREVVGNAPSLVHYTATEGGKGAAGDGATFGTAQRRRKRNKF